MAQVSESVLSSNRQPGAVLAEGIDLVGQEQDVAFERYVRYVLPLDGSVFWVRASALSPSAIGNTSMLGRFLFNGPRVVVGAPNRIVARGSLHYATTRPQTEDGASAINRVVFTTFVPILDLNRIGDDELYIATWPSYPVVPESITANPAAGSSEAGGIGIGQSAVQGVDIEARVGNARPPPVIRFTFSRRTSFYQQSGRYHYEGDAVYPDLGTQIVDSSNQLNRSLVVSNSLPLWLGLDRYFPVYPSFLQPFNLEPPYATVHIPPEGTRALQSVPELRVDPPRESNGAIGQMRIGIGPIGGGSQVGRTSTHWQLAHDTVRVSLVGVRNQLALTWFDYVLAFIGDTDGRYMGLMNTPIVRDEKRAQAELGTIAQKKTIEFEVSYYQTAVEAVARQLILHAVPNFIVT